MKPLNKRFYKKKREAERKRYEKIKNDPQKREELREKERLRYLKKKGARKLVENTTPRQHRDANKKWKEHYTKYHNKKNVLANITNSFIKENTPDSYVSTSCQMSTPEVAQIINKNKEKMLRYKIKKDEEIKELQKKVQKTFIATKKENKAL